MARDPGLLSATRTYTIYVLNSNDPPVVTNITANIDVGSVGPGVEVTSVQAYDADGMLRALRMALCGVVCVCVLRGWGLAVCWLG
jgi:hypothetical protein